VPGRKRKEIKGAQPSPNKKKGGIYNNGDLFQTCHQSRERLKHQTASPAVFLKHFLFVVFLKRTNIGVKIISFFFYF
jgi:hypothetical protein